MIVQIEVAGIVFEVNVRYQSTILFAEGFIVSGKPVDFFIDIHYSDLEYEWRMMQLYNKDLKIPDKLKLTTVFERQIIYHKILEKIWLHSSVLMHGAVVSDNSSAYMFAGPGGVGKTTRGKLFIELHPEFFFLNGDKPLVRVEKDRLIALGSPWKGKEGFGENSEAPLKAVFLLERAEKTVVNEISFVEAYDFLLKQLYLPCEYESMMSTIKLFQLFKDKTRFFRFQSELSRNSVEAAWKAVNDR